MIHATCPQCQKPFSGPDTLGGKRIRCLTCRTVFVLPASSSAAEPVGSAGPLPVVKPIPASPVLPRAAAPPAPANHRPEQSAWDDAPDGHSLESASVVDERKRSRPPRRKRRRRTESGIDVAQILSQWAPIILLAVLIVVVAWLLYGFATTQAETGRGIRGTGLLFGLIVKGFLIYFLYSRSTR